jgi:hypothetical protein
MMGNTNTINSTSAGMKNTAVIGPPSLKRKQKSITASVRVHPG